MSSNFNRIPQEVADVIASPSRNNKGHANIVLPFNQAIGEPLSAEMLKLSKDLADHAVILQDPDINAQSWQGGDF